MRTGGRRRRPSSSTLRGTRGCSPRGSPWRTTMRAPLLSRTATARTATMMTTTGRRRSGGGRWERRPRRRRQRDARGGGRGDARGGRLRRRRGDARGGLCEVSVGGGRAAGWKGEGDEEEADRPREEEEEVVGRQEEGAGGQKKNEKSDGKKKKKPSDDEKKPNRGKKCPYGKKKKKPEDPRTKRKSARRRGVQTRALTAPRSGRGPSCLRPVIAAGRGGGHLLPRWPPRTARRRARPGRASLLDPGGGFRSASSWTCRTTATCRP